MNEQDIDLYLRAKNPWRLGNIAAGIALLMAGLALVVSFIPALSSYARYALLLAFIVGTSTYGVGHRSYVSRRDLLALIDRSINSDPKLIAMVSSRMSRKSLQPK